MNINIDINKLSSTCTPKDILNSLFSNNWRNMFIGKAGAGKTYVLRNAGANYNIELLAPSNLAASVLGGRTLCSWLGGIRDLSTCTLNSLDKDKVRRALVSMAMEPDEEYKGVYMDEMSFYNTEVFEFIDALFDETNKYLISNGYKPIHLIWGGDFLQLVAINGNPIHSSPLLSEYKITITPNVYRQKDNDWLECLSAIREGKEDQVKEYFKDANVQTTQLSNTLLKVSSLGPYGLYIVGTQRDVYSYSGIACMELANENKAPKYSYWNGYVREVKQTYNKQINIPKKRYLHLTKGIRIKASKNDFRNGIVKGQFGTVIDCSKNHIDVLFDNDIEYTYLYETSPLDLEPGIAATVHSVQGLTIPEGSIAMIDLLASFCCETLGGLYVACSRTVLKQNTVLRVKCWSDIRKKILIDKEALMKGLY